MLNISADGDTVLTERVDVFTLPNAPIELPVMGTFEVAAARSPPGATTSTSTSS